MDVTFTSNGKGVGKEASWNERAKEKVQTIWQKQMKWISSTCQNVIQDVLQWKIVSAARVLSCNDSHEAIVQHQSSVRDIFRFIVRVTATGDPSQPKTSLWRYLKT